ncbi:MAG: redoxin domain-containing protein [Dehalococcoidia bacterium]
MKIKIGDKLENIKLKSISGEDFELGKTKGKKILLSFYRFAACPMCNLRINELMKSYDSFGKNFMHVAIFDSKIDNFKKVYI